MSTTLYRIKYSQKWVSKEETNGPCVLIDPAHHFYVVEMGHLGKSGGERKNHKTFYLLTFLHCLIIPVHSKIDRPGLSLAWLRASGSQNVLPAFNFVTE